MPGSGYAGLFGSYFGEELVESVESTGGVSEARLSDMAIRVLSEYSTFFSPQYDFVAVCCCLAGDAVSLMTDKDI